MVKIIVNSPICCKILQTIMFNWILSLFALEIRFLSLFFLNKSYLSCLSRGGKHFFYFYGLSWNFDNNSNHHKHNKLVSGLQLQTLSPRGSENKRCRRNPSFDTTTSCDSQPLKLNYIFVLE